MDREAREEMRGEWVSQGDPQLALGVFAMALYGPLKWKHRPQVVGCGKFRQKSRLGAHTQRWVLRPKLP